MGFAGKLIMDCRLVLSAILLLAAPSALGLGLGEITLNSALNEPLDAEIVVLNAEDLEDGQMLVSLASPEAFERAGISRDFFYSQMQLSISRNNANLYIIKLATEQPVIEPYLNFLIQLQWPAGRVMREYTLLLDLPIYTDQQQPQSIAPATGSASPRLQPAKSPMPYRQPLSGDNHQVIVGDTLWNVAVRLRPENTTILQTMDSLYRHNADAFVEGDANRIKAGSVLRLPSQGEISVEAGNTVAAQIGLSNPAIVSTAPDLAVEQANASADNVPLQAQLLDDGRLELASAVAEEQVADDQQLPDQASAKVSDQALAAGLDRQGRNDEAQQVNQLAEELAVANDEINRAQQENIELRERLALLEAQVATMVALLEQAEKTALVTAGSSATNLSNNSRESQGLGQQLAAVPTYFWLLIIAIILLLLVLLARKSSQQHSSARSDELPMDGGYEDYDESTAGSGSTQNELHALDDLELDPADNLFSDSNADIFDFDEESESSEVFDMGAEAVAEADVYLSLGKTAEAIDVLEEARGKDPADVSSRLKLMEVLFRENRKGELKALFGEIEASGDKTATEMAAIIIGPEKQSPKVTAIAEEPVAAELEGLDFQRTEFEDLGLGNIDLADLELDDLQASDIDYAGDQLEDLNLDNLTADDFDIEPADDQPEPVQDQPEPIQEHPEPQMPDTEALDNRRDIAADSLMDEFAEFDVVDDQSVVDVKLDLAKTYLEMGDPEGAREILEELIEESDEDGQNRAQALLKTL